MIKGTSWSNYSVIPYRFCTSKTESFWHILVYESSPPLRLTFNNIMVLCSIHTIMAGKKYILQTNSNQTRHVQFESGKIGKLPVLRKERKTKHTQIALLI